MLPEAVAQRIVGFYALFRGKAMNGRCFLRHRSSLRARTAFTNRTLAGVPGRGPRLGKPAVFWIRNALDDLVDFGGLNGVESVGGMGVV